MMRRLRKSRKFHEFGMGEEIIFVFFPAMSSWSTPQRDLDVVVWGATGFTGKLVSAYLHGDQSQFFSCKLSGPAAAPNLKWGGSWPGTSRS